MNLSLHSPFPMATPEKTQQRLATCHACEFRGEIPLTHTAVCKACGCPLVNKTKFLKSSCPKGKW